MTEYFNRVPQKGLRRHLRAETTATERLLWGKLSRKQLLGMSFRRQYSVGRYVLDFYCAQAKLGVELDGRTHATPEAKEYDEVRGQFIEALGIQLLRISNRDVYERIDEVLALIAAALRRPPSFPPS